MDVRLPVLRLPLVPRNPLQPVVIEDNSFRKLMESVRNIRIGRYGTMLVQAMGTMASVNYTYSSSIVSNSYHINYLYKKNLEKKFLKDRYYLENTFCILL